MNGKCGTAQKEMLWININEFVFWIHKAFNGELSGVVNVPQAVYAKIDRYSHLKNVGPQIVDLLLSSIIVGFHHCGKAGESRSAGCHSNEAMKLE
jgi:hypothetical protein